MYLPCLCVKFSFYVHFPSCEFSELITQRPIYSIGLSYLLDDFSSEKARPMFPTTNWVNGTEARLLGRTLGFGPANQNIHDTPQKGLSNLTTCFTMPLGSYSSLCAFLSLFSFVCTCTSLQLGLSRIIFESVCLVDRACRVYRCLAVSPSKKNRGSWIQALRSSFLSSGGPKS